MKICTKNKLMNLHLNYTFKLYIIFHAKNSVHKHLLIIFWTPSCYFPPERSLKPVIFYHQRLPWHCQECGTWYSNRNQTIANTFFHQVCSGHCFLVCFQDTGFLSYEHWEQSASLRGTSTSLHALRQNGYVLCLALVCHAVCCCVLRGRPWKTRSCWSHPHFYGTTLLDVCVYVCVGGGECRQAGACMYVLQWVMYVCV